MVLENFDKMAVAGTHFSSQHMLPSFPAIPGHHGVGTLPDGSLVTFGGVKAPYGSMAEKAIPEAEKQVWNWIKDKKLIFEIEKMALKNISNAWQRNTQEKRIVIIP